MKVLSGLFLKESISLIIGNISEAASGFSKYPEAVREALQYLCQQDFKNMADGRYPIHGEDSFAILQRYNTRVPESGKPEAHRQYVDIQYIVEGREELGWCPMSPELKVCEPYDGEKDIVFFDKLIPISGITLEAGSFAVLYPTDVHRPCGSLGDSSVPVTKVVVKIAVDSIK